MKRPENAILDKIETTIAEIHALREQLKLDVRAIEDIENKRTRIEVAIYAYWHMPEVSAEELAWAATKQKHPGRLLKLAGPITKGIRCDACGNELAIRSREQMKTVLQRLGKDAHWPEGYRVICASCEERILEDRRTEGDKDFSREEARLRWLGSLSYSEYLKTPDWATTLQNHIDYLRQERRSSILLCDVCGSEPAVGAYHKTLEHRGREGADDLLLLGDLCLSVVDSNSLIAGIPCNQNLLANCRPTSIENEIKE